MPPPRSPLTDVLRGALVVAIAVAILLLGIFLGGHPSNLPGFIRNEFVGDRDTRVVQEAIDRVHQSYYRKISETDLANAAVRGIVTSLHDRFSEYFDPKENKAFQAFSDSRFTGIGTLVSPDKRGLLITQVYPKSPAQAAGLRAGDVITGANGHSLAGLTEEAAVGRVKGPENTSVSLTYLRGKRSRTVTVKRKTINVPVVATRTATVDGKKLGVLALSQFSDGAHGEVYAGLEKLLKAHVRGIVFDLRDNGGGLITEAQLIASAFLSDGPIVTTRGRDEPTKTLDATGEPVVPKLPLVVLVNRNTASASEIVTGALQDRHRALVIGTHTFGKGVFQEVDGLSNGGALKITAGQYFTPSGRNLGGRGVKEGAGITPNVKAADNPKTPRRDEGLEIALKTLAAHVKG